MCVVTAVATIVALLPTNAFAGGSSLESETFANNATAPGQWYLPAGQGGTNGSCLTAGPVSGTTSIPNCASPPDSNGSGALRLTTNAGDAVGAAFYQTSLPTSEGLDVNLETYQFDGTGADGIVFSLAAANPADPMPPATTGPLGGNLGYAAASGGSGAAGMPYGYLGIGLDVYGNYENTPLAGGSGCTIPSPLVANKAYPESVTARGPGNGTVGYCILGTTATSFNQSDGGGSANGTVSNLGPGLTLDNQSATSRTGVMVPVEMAINPSAAVTTTASGLSVPASSWLIAFTPLGTTTQQTLTGALPTTSNNAALATFPSSWIDPATGIPYQLTFGWTASTGGSNEYHEVNQLTASTLVGAVPNLAITTSDNEGGHMLAGNKANFILAPSVASSGGAEFEHAHRHRYIAHGHDAGRGNEQLRLGVRDRRSDGDVHVHARLGNRCRNHTAEHNDSRDALVRAERQRDELGAHLVHGCASRGEQRRRQRQRVHRNGASVAADVPAAGDVRRGAPLERDGNRHLLHRRHDVVHHDTSGVELQHEHRPRGREHRDRVILG